jgi:hypothetical protein
MKKRNLTTRDWNRIFVIPRQRLEKLRSELASQTPIFDESFLADFQPNSKPRRKKVLVADRTALNFLHKKYLLTLSSPGCSR